MILFVSNSPFLGGAEHYLLDIVKGVKDQFNIKFATPEGLVEEEVKRLGVDIIDINIGSTMGRFRGMNLFNLRNVFRISKLRGLLKNLASDDKKLVIHTQDYKEMVLFTLAAKELPVKLIYVQHTILPGWLKRNPIILKYLVNIWNKQDLVIAVSDGVKNELISVGVNPAKVKRVYNGIDLNLFKTFTEKEKKTLRKQNNLDNKLTIGLTGRIAWGKGQDILISALPEILKKFPNIHALFIGTGSSIRQARLDRLVKSLNLEDKVTFFGSWPRNKIPEYYAMLDIFVLPSLSEGLPLSILEALAMEVPCIGTRIAGIPEEIIDKKNGFLMKGRTSSELAQLCKKLLSDEKLRQKFGKEGRKLVEEKFDKDLMVSNMKNLYNKVLI